jgi:hypothetical protein
MTEDSESHKIASTNTAAQAVLQEWFKFGEATKRPRENYRPALVALFIKPPGIIRRYGQK